MTVPTTLHEHPPCVPTDNSAEIAIYSELNIRGVTPLVRCLLEEVRAHRKLKVPCQKFAVVDLSNDIITTYICPSWAGPLKLPSRATASVCHRASPFRRLKMILGGVGIS